VKAIDRKVWRDLAHMKGQSVAIAFVLAGGVATFVLSLSAVESLDAARAAYYERYRFADVFAALERAPLALAERLEEIPGVARVEPRVTTEATLDVPGLVEAASARVLSLPRREGGLNALHLRSGRIPEAHGRHEVVVSEPFAEVHGYAPGSTLDAVIRGKRERLEVVGVGISPEFIFQMRPGEFFPDHSRYAILWMDYDELAPAVDMDGAFNDVAIRLQRGASEADVLERVDVLLAPYGGLGAHGRSEQISHEFVMNEIHGLRAMALIPPLIFLSVAGFLLHVVVSRLVGLQREQIAVLKSFGYGRFEIGLHFLKLISVIIVAGVVLGLAGGAWLGSGMTAMYSQFFRFPSFDYRLPFVVLAPSVAIAFGAGIAGTLGAVRRATNLAPAEAMRPEPPARFHATLLERLGFQRWLSPAARMVLRNLERHPVKAGLSTLGVALAVAVLILGSYFLDAMDEMIDIQFFRMQRQDVTVTFTDSASPSAYYEVARLRGVIRAEPFRSVATRVRAGHLSRRLGLLGVSRGAALQRVLDADGREVTLPTRGVAVSEVLAEKLGVTIGDELTVEVMEGERPVRQLEIAATVEDFSGMSAWMDLGALRRWMHEGETLSGAYLSVDSRELGRLHATLKEMPGVLGASTRASTLENFRKMVAENLLIMRFINSFFASIIAVGVVYNAARIALSERARELATLRILGFSRAEISTILLGELAAIVFLAIGPGLFLGYGLAALANTGMSTDTQRFPLVVFPRTYSFAVTVVVVAALASALLVRRRLDRLDLIAVLKSRE
jgi:putative ABC transport system permease protein